jgi:predicted nucleotidyltransferase
MRFGLTEKQFQLIEDTIISIREIEKILIFGSRAKDTFKPSSDIDLAIIGKNITPDIINKISSQLDDLPLPFMFDVINYNTISNIALKERIDSQGKSFFERQLKTA